MPGNVYLYAFYAVDARHRTFNLKFRKLCCKLQKTNGDLGKIHEALIIV
jgi:hypothetical protein